ncbi:MAG: mechanosensitive ion channel protein MscS [Bacteroidetes bacterium CG12_big_fil_rev_8_21_14_0_65_60_17]|nr:MAG: mechanosensitive ion channel protein MscS [Bacteroidetes bacterium CG12_big_fil_rev_8_21_14_0_65_60_17]
MDILTTQEFFGWPLLEWAKLIGLWVLFTALGLGIRRVFFGRFTALAARTTNRVDDVVAELLGGARTWFLAVLALYLATRYHTQDAPALAWLLRLVFLGLLVQLGLWGNDIIRLAATWYAEARNEEPAQVTAVKAIGLVGKLVLWSVLFLVALDNFGIDITALIAGLGIGGIAIALAVQNVLQDLLAYISIVVDQPFVYGDFLVLDDLSGTVEHIGIKTTRLRSLSGEQIIISNNDLLSTRVRNFKRMYERRVVFSVGVTYGTPHETLQAIPGMLQAAVESCADVRFDRSHLKEFGNFSINFETVYYVLVSDYAVYMERQQEINLAIHRKFQAEGIEFAFPTQTLHVESLPAGSTP